MARVSAPHLFSPLVLATLLVGCSSNVLSPGGSRIPTITSAPQAEDRLHQQANDALERWAAAVRDSGGASITFVGALTSQIGTWEEANADNKKALEAGILESSTTLPHDLPGRREVKWVDGTKVDVDVLSARQSFDALIDSATGDCADCDSIRITDANLATGLVETATGPAEVPMWVYSVRGSAVRITRVAVDTSVTVTPGPWNVDDPPAGVSIAAARGDSGSKTLEVDFVGANETCDFDYDVEAVESDLAVVVIVDERLQPGGDPGCPTSRLLRTAKVTLDSALGDRVVLEGRQGLPVPVTRPGVEP